MEQVPPRSVYTNGATSVTLVGGTTDAVVDEATTQALTTLTITGEAGIATASGNALTTFNLNKMGSASGLTVTNSTAGHTDTVTINTLSGGTVPVFRDDVAKTISVVATGASNSVAVTDGLAGVVNLSFTNNGTGTLTLGTLTEGGLTGTSGVTTGTFTLAGTGAINVGTAFSLTYNGNTYGTLTQNGTGAVTGTVNVGQNFAGGTAQGDVITVGGAGATTISGSIVGGSGGSNTAIFSGDVYTVARRCGCFPASRSLNCQVLTSVAMPPAQLLGPGVVPA